ncbi:hypothetical protein WR25_00109 [Diploscapter pachys]|uniref:Uncharacterized protein n=1 Tax=Diploscapter pachys TaxID=2018661 RepID=A0A2A2M2W4_9BILA|nr:hypothetical protein WR25_00109 [Diploscapter pachys]
MTGGEKKKRDPGSAAGVTVMTECPPYFVTPDLVRGPPGREGTARGSGCPPRRGVDPGPSPGPSASAVARWLKRCSASARASSSRSKRATRDLKSDGPASQAATGLSSTSADGEDGAGAGVGVLPPLAPRRAPSCGR